MAQTQVVILGEDDLWVSILPKRPDREYICVTSAEALKKLLLKPLPIQPDVIVIDVSAVFDPIAWVNVLRDCFVSSRVVVLGAAPNWPLVRSVLKRGAVAFWDKIYDRARVDQQLDEVLSQVPLPREERMIKPRILYYDNEREDLERLQETLQLEGYEIETFWVQTREDILYLKQRLQNEWWHLIIGDIALINEDEEKGVDEEGLTLALGLDSVVPLIIWTAHPNWARAYRALRGDNGESKAKAFDFIDKADIQSTNKLLQAVRQVFTTDPHRINFNLSISYLDDFSFLELIRAFDEDFGKIDGVSQLQLRHDELADLLRKLFFENKAIQVGRALKRRRTALIKVAFQGLWGTPSTVLVELGPRPVIRDLKDKWDRYMTVLHPNAQLVAAVETLRYGALAYRLEGEIEEYKTFRNYYRIHPPEVVRDFLEHLFMNELQPWFEVDAEIGSSAYPLGEFYRKWLDLEGHKVDLQSIFQREVRRLSIVRLDRQVQGYRLELDAREYLLPDPLQVVYEGKLLEKSYPLAVTHGAMTANGLLIAPGGRWWLLGAESIGASHCWRDLISLEGAIMFELAESAVLPEETWLRGLCEWLSPSQPDDKIVLSGQSSEFYKAFETINHIRSLAKRLAPDEDLYAYYLGLLMVMARNLLTSRTRESSAPLVLMLFLLASRVSGWPRWDLLRSGLSKGIQLDEVRRRVFVPAKGEWVLLSEQETQLLSFLLAHPNTVIAWEAVDKILWPGGEVSKEMRQKAVSRLRAKIEIDSKHPVYLHVLRGKGIEFRPA
ncbi:winged helix-turn-helix domain-containing protein [uncultured Thermanaerothrix sp.]|uniref:winged helix-turn-helix domain-containing protein n=1 Tax=uncultured Thermanaerothrix sp. TaxID=1195149 RepID=UPI002611F28D|nr:winged helix-turn-helix domain-containing protein [uncultured Thermanaerothrix sp.]